MNSETFEFRFTTDNQEGTKSVIARWLKQVGEQVTAHEPLVEVSTDKVSMELAAPASGILSEIKMGADAEINPGDLLALIAKGDCTQDSGAKNESNAIKLSQSLAGDAEQTRLSPAVKQLLKQHGLSANQISGSGKEGRITAEDVQKFLDRSANTSSSTGHGSTLVGRKVPHSAMRKMIAEHMVQSLLHTAPHVTTVFDCDLSTVLKHRESHKEEFEKNGVRLTLTSYFAMACVRALKAVPEVNSRFHKDALEIFDIINIGIATALEKDGLIVPVIKDAGSLDLFKMASTLQNLTSKAREGKLSSSDVQDATFTITNHGVSGSLIATPIISQPQSAILGIGKLERRPVVVKHGGKESLEISSRAYVTLTIDHRALDGFVANSFMTAFVSAIESWES